MNRRIVIFLIICQIMVLGGCARVRNGDGQAAQVGDVGRRETEAITSYLAGNFESYRQTVASENGYYYMGRYILYMDKETKESIYLCGRPDCTHSDANCDAYVGTVLPSSLCYAEGYLYVLGYDKLTYEVSLIRISPDGSEHEDLGRIGVSDEQASTYEYFIVGNYMYYVYKMYTLKPDNVYEIKRVSLDTMEEETLYACEGAIFYQMILWGDKLYFMQRSTAVDENSGIGETKLMSLDINTLETEEYVGGSIFSYTVDYVNNRLYYQVLWDGIYEYSLSEGDSRKLVSYEEGTESLYLVFDGEYIYGDNSYTSFKLNKGVPYQLYVYDTEGKPVRIYRGLSPICLPGVVDGGIIVYTGAGSRERSFMYADVHDASVAEFTVSQ